MWPCRKPQNRRTANWTTDGIVLVPVAEGCRPRKQHKDGFFDLPPALQVLALFLSFFIPFYKSLLALLLAAHIIKLRLRLPANHNKKTNQGQGFSGDIHKKQRISFGGYIREVAKVLFIMEQANGLILI